ncbi:unnamed protein product, partial [Onchocerca ochengi]|uniref:Uncharacterized protein n=1 Tax=Onchocerca ochengi TaxID=42157 RepID=A0A182EYY5_ONCOC
MSSSIIAKIQPAKT